MAKYKVKTRGYQLIVKARLALKEKLDEGQFTLFSDKNIRGLLRPKRLGRNAIQYSGPVGISLAERLKKPVNKYDFLFIMEQIVVIFQKLKANSLAAGHLILDVRYVFINETTKEVLFIYLPLEQAGGGGGYICLYGVRHLFRDFCPGRRYGLYIPICVFYQEPEYL